ncbi:50S ribosomal protein L11 methyltransferase [Rhabdochromatium marinum]|uniref:50S ribosomal protein L11 methyltransferase n=1 Tax=Rhabdochromatium marinum TaxID=48729 RepID=UPI00190896D5|nr:50S ribosomal protein L11 methyltransferase [Rhabdochromatium marinum]MBK1647892.1 50S ribosomal protein L11 methyltransferase [Rhabdochromatium marinum]
MSWLQLALIAARDQVPLLEVVLENAGALAVTLDDPEDHGPYQPEMLRPADLSLLEPAPGAMPLWALVRVTALFEDCPEARASAEQAATLLRDSLAAPATLEALADQVWERAWLEHWRPQRFGHRLWVCPHEQAPPAASTMPPPVIVSLDPGLAFGTGSHPTTALCLAWLDSLDLRGKTVIDYGCGSGILAIAALKLGAAQALAIDYDPQALTATLSNAQANGVADRLQVQDTETKPTRPAEVVVANILAGILIELAPTLTNLCTANAQVALSGLLEPQIPPVLAAYREHITFAAPVIQNQWALLSGQAHHSR